jgi:hypothetical protein
MPFKKYQWSIGAALDKSAAETESPFNKYEVALEPGWVVTPSGAPLR